MKTKEAQEELKYLQNINDKKRNVRAGCTACMVLFVGDTLYIANAGDSRCVLSHYKNTIQLTTDHTPELPSEKKRIEDAGGYISRRGRIMDNLNLSRAIGDLDYKDDSNLSVKEQLIIAVPDIKVMKITDEDEFLIIGCDGIWGYFKNQEIVEFVGYRLEKGIKISKICGELFERLIAPDKRSNSSI